MGPTGRAEGTHAQLAFVPRFEKRGNAFPELREAGMFTHAPPPVFRVSVVRLAAMHDRVNQAAVRSFSALRDRVRGVEVVMPVQNQSAQELPEGG